MAVQVVESAPRCKLCRHDERAAIDELLEKRSLRQKAEDGSPINLSYVLDRLREMGVENPNQDNLKNHWKKHCRQVSERKAAEEEELRQDILARIESGELDLIDVDEATRKLMTLTYYELLDKSKRGEKTGLTADHFIKFGDLLTKRRNNEKTQEMMEALGGAVAMALLPKEAQGALPAGDEVEGELVEEGEFDDV